MVMRGYITFKNRKALNYLLKHGFVYTLRRINRKTGVVTLKDGNYRDLGLVMVEYIGLVRKVNGKYIVFRLDGETELLENYVAGSGFNSVDEWLKAFESLTGKTEPKRLYKVTLLRLFKWSTLTDFYKK